MLTLDRKDWQNQIKLKEQTDSEAGLNCLLWLWKTIIFELIQ